MMILKKIQAIRGMKDILPKDALLFRHLEQVLINILISYGYNEIRLPIIEMTQLFKRAIGLVTDVVEKEMYSFNDRNGESVTLRPEGTASCVRACIEHNLFYRSQEQRLWYLGPMFRRERPQKGRFRQFYQLSAEAFGNFGPYIDAELIMMTARFWKVLGISEYLSLELNSIGSFESRSLYCKELSDFLFKHFDLLDENSRRRIHSNPIRILDSKDQNVQKLLRNAPVLTQFLDIKCRVHFDDVCTLLNKYGIVYTVNSRLIRGLDYYNRTVFEWINNSHLGSQKTVCAGGRYDRLVSELGGPSVPAIGFSVGLDRLFLLMSSIDFKCRKCLSYSVLDIYIAVSKVSDYELAVLLSESIHDVLPFIRLQINYIFGNLKQHFKKAHRHGARIVLVLGSNKMLQDHIILKDFFCNKEEEFIYSVLIDKLLLIFGKERKDG